MPSDIASKGGKARAKALLPERRREIAQKAAKARWKNHKSKKRQADEKIEKTA